MEEQVHLFDVCIVCALYEEANAVVQEFTARCGVTFTQGWSQHDHYTYHFATIQNQQGEPLTVAVTWLPKTGPIQTAMDLKVLLQNFRPRFAAMTGICAGSQEVVRLGDLIVASTAYSYEEGKTVLGSDERPELKGEPTMVSPTDQVLQYARGFLRWEQPVAELKCQSLSDTEAPRLHIAAMASGMTVRADSPFSWLREKYHRHTAALDMEAASFYQVLRAFPTIHTLVVKGVCDYADSRKNDIYHQFAAQASAIYLLLFIQEYVTQETMPRRDGTEHSEPFGVWNVPYQRNPHFTGRDELLNQLVQQLAPETRKDLTTTRRAALTQPQAIKGLGGIGKTQIAVEYAYRSRDLGRYTHTFWVNAASREAIIASFEMLAELLPAFSAKGETDQHKLVIAIQRWLEQCQHYWLLIFDNADDVSIIQEYLPRRGNGSILLTTRSHAVGSFAVSLEVETMGLIEGTHLLLRRAQRLEQAYDAEFDSAGNIVVALDHFPLAIDQAGAYIEESGCSLGDYLNIYQNHRKDLLARRGIQATSYPDAVATTWSISFRKIELANPAATELLSLLAFCAPDAIPEELIREGKKHWPPLLQQAVADLFTFEKMCEDLLKFSLVKHLAGTHTLSIHRLVQAVLMDSLELEVQRRWAERVLRTVNEIFPPDPTNIVAWPQCLQYLDQAQVCTTLVEQYALPLVEAAELFYRAGLYLAQHASYTLAELLYQRSLALYEQLVGTGHPDTAKCLNGLASIYRAWGKYNEAEPLCKRALALYEQQFGADHVSTAAGLHNLASLYRLQGKYREAESLYQRVLAIRERQLGADHPDTAQILNSLAYLYQVQGKYQEAEPLYRQSLAIREQCLGEKHPKTALSLNNLALFYWGQGRFEEAEPLQMRALAICKEVFGPAHPETARSLNNLALLYDDEGKYDEAEALYKRAIAILEQQLSAHHPETAKSLNSLAELYRVKGLYEEAEVLCKRAIASCEQQLGQNHPDTTLGLYLLAGIYWDQGKVEEAESLYQRTITLYTQQLGADHPSTARSLNSLADFYRSQRKYDEAEPLCKRALVIREQLLGTRHPDTATSLNSLAELYRALGRYEEAESCYRSALLIREQLLSADHPDTARSLTGLAELSRSQGKNEQAELLYQRALATCEQRLGTDHPETRAIRRNYLTLIQARTSPPPV
jgi:tetratricopeptide (TPR) repeat protein